MRSLHFQEDRRERGCCENSHVSTCGAWDMLVGKSRSDLYCRTEHGWFYDQDGHTVHVPSQRCYITSVKCHSGTGLSLEASCGWETALSYHLWWKSGTTEVKQGNFHFGARLKANDGWEARRLKLEETIDVLPFSGSHSPLSLCHAFIPGLLLLAPCSLLQGQHRPV